MIRSSITNDKGIQRDIYVRREAKKAFMVGPLYTFLILGLTYISMSKWVVFFYFSGLFLMLLAIILFIFAPLRMLNRHNRTIASISIEEDKVCFKTFNALWMKSKEIVIPKSQLRAKYSKFNWYGTAVKEGLKIYGTSSCEFYLVKDFFGEFEMIRNSVLEEIISSET
jgi:hypothetical protein